MSALLTVLETWSTTGWKVGYVITIVVVLVVVVLVVPILLLAHKIGGQAFRHRRVPQAVGDQHRRAGAAPHDDRPRDEIIAGLNRGRKRLGG